ncbi:RNA polymerase sigma factor [Streptomyces sp. NPDC050504]|uniref:RNA polymerase sigma factor n=1 Tax=Streptomyces sp. NPDC050504 TaxID=3365618 RepID=UPI0037AF5C87
MTEVGEETMQARESMHDFYERMCPKLISRARKACRNMQDAEDVVQESFAAVLPKWEEYSRYESPDAVVQLVLNRRLWNLQKRRERWLGRVRLAPLPAPTPDPQFSAETSELLAVLGELPQRQRTVLVLHAWNGLSTQEIADELGISVSTVRVHMYKARTSLKRWLDLEESEADRLDFLPASGGDEVALAAVRRAGEELLGHLEADRAIQERILAALKSTAARQGWLFDGER